MTTKRRWSRIRLPFAAPHVWYRLRPERAERAPQFKLGRSARALGPENASGRLWLLDPRGAAWCVAAEDFTRRDPGTAAPGGLRFMAGRQLVSAFLVEGVWRLSAGGHPLEEPGLAMLRGEHWTATLAKLRVRVEGSAVG